MVNLFQRAMAQLWARVACLRAAEAQHFHGAGTLWGSSLRNTKLPPPLNGLLFLAIPGATSTSTTTQDRLLAATEHSILHCKNDWNWGSEERSKGHQRAG
jgi:hypothetical protein